MFASPADWEDQGIARSTCFLRINQKRNAVLCWKRPSSVGRNIDISRLNSQVVESAECQVPFQRPAEAKSWLRTNYCRELREGKTTIFKHCILDWRIGVLWEIWTFKWNIQNISTKFFINSPSCWVPHRWDWPRVHPNWKNPVRLFREKVWQVPTAQWGRLFHNRTAISRGGKIYSCQVLY